MSKGDNIKLLRERLFGDAPCYLTKIVRVTPKYYYWADIDNPDRTGKARRSDTPHWHLDPCPYCPDQLEP